MKLMSQQIKQLILLSILLFPLIGNALQLGKIVVTSSQGQPLNAEIEIMLTPGEDISKFQASLASKENYESQGIERLSIHNNISVILQKNEKGLTVLKLKSIQPVLDPFLDLFIQVDSAKGRNYREYTVLLDPPETLISQQEKIVAVDKTDPIPKNEKKELMEDFNKNKDAEEKVIKNNFEPLKKNTLENLASKSIVVKPRDTAFKLAREYKIPNITVEQMVIGIFNLNEFAFINKNINGIQVGQKIILPTRDDFINLSHTKALAEIKIQSTQWNKFSTKTAEAAANASKESDVQSENFLTPSTTIQNQPTTLTPRIKLTGDTLSTIKNSKEVEPKEMNSMTDDKIALEKNIKDIEQKIQLLEKELADAKKIFALSSQTLFELQEKSKQAIQSKDFTNKELVLKDPIVESKSDLNSLINKLNDEEVNKNELVPPVDTSFKSSISDESTDQEASAQLASAKEPSNMLPFESLFISLIALSAALIMILVMKSKRQQEQKKLIGSMNKDNTMVVTEEVNIDLSSIKEDNIIKAIDLSDIEINISDKDHKPTRSD